MSSEQKLHKEIDHLRRMVKIHSSRSTHWCPIVSSPEIRKLLIERCNEVGVTIYEMAIRVGVSSKILREKYVEADQMMSSSSLRAEDIIKMGELLNVGIRVRVFVGDIEEVERDKLTNEKYIPFVGRQKNKKLGK